MSKRSRKANFEQDQYVGLDVSLAETTIAVVDGDGKLVWRGKVDSTPQAIAEALRLHTPHAERIGLEAGQLASWLHQGLRALGLPVICVDARHAKAALSLRLNKTDILRGAAGIGRLARQHLSDTRPLLVIELVPLRHSLRSESVDPECYESEPIPDGNPECRLNLVRPIEGDTLRIVIVQASAEKRDLMLVGGSA